MSKQPFIYQGKSFKVSKLSLKRPVWKLPPIIKPVPKGEYTCEGGPFSGKLIVLTDGTTMLFRVGHFKGRYLAGQMAWKGRYGTCKWAENENQK